MGNILLIALLLVLAAVLLLLELLVLPGITVAGVTGIFMLAGAIFLCYSIFGTLAGHLVLGASLLVVLVMVVYALKAGTWKRISLQATVTGKVNTINKDRIAPGDTGKTLTRLNPMGKVVVNEEVLEARSEEGLLDEGTQIVVVRILDSGIVVKPKIN